MQINPGHRIAVVRTLLPAHLSTGHRIMAVRTLGVGIAPVRFRVARQNIKGGRVKGGYSGGSTPPGPTKSNIAISTIIRNPSSMARISNYL